MSKINLAKEKLIKEAEGHGISPSIAVSRYKHEANWYKTASYKSPKIR